MSSDVHRPNGRAQLMRGLAVAAAMATMQSLPVSAQQAPAQVPDGSVGGMGDINLYPKRLVIDGRQRIATLGLYNKVATAGEYEIVVNDMAMLPDGQIVDPAQADPAIRARFRSAAQMLRWSPRRLVLGGNEAQTIRIMARVAPDQPPGEYHAHITVVAVPPPEAGANSIEDAAGRAAGSRQIGVRIVPRFGIAIPAIVRIGETTLTAGVRDLAVVTAADGTRSINLTLTRSGTRSAFGDVVVTAPGVKQPIAQLKGIGVYTEIDSRQVAIPVDSRADPRHLAKGARLTVTYIDDDVAPGGTLARQEFVVP